MPGPAKGQTCMVCNHPGIVLINNQINSGASDYKVAGAFKLPRAACRRHRVNGHPGIKPAAVTRGTDLGAVTRETPPDDRPAPAPADDDGEEGDPREKLERLVKTLEAQATDDARPEVFRELRLALEALNKMGATNQLVVRVADVEGLRAMIAEMHEALKPWPEAREAVARVWAEHRLVGAGDD